MINGKFSTSNNSSNFTLTSPSINSTNDEVCSLQNPIHEKIKYLELYKIQARYFRRESGLNNTQVKLLARKTWLTLMLEYFLKEKSMKEVISEINRTNTSSTEEITYDYYHVQDLWLGYVGRNVRSNFSWKKITRSAWELLKSK